MPKPLFRSLRVQVLLWTILPLLIVLLTFSLSGVGSHQFSVRQLVVEENANLIGVAAQAIQARLALYSSHLAAQDLPAQDLPAPLAPGGAQPLTSAAPSATPGEQTGAPAAAGSWPAPQPGALSPLAIWRVAPSAPAPAAGADAAPAPPAWVTRAVDAAVAQGGQAWLGLDAAAGRIVWAQPQTAGGWLVASAPGAALGLAGLFPAGPTAPALAVVDAQMQVVDANRPTADLAPALPALAPMIRAALAGRRGVEFVELADVQTAVAYAPLPGAPWAILIQRPVGDLGGPFFRYEEVLPLILLAAALVSFLTLYFGLRLVVRPVQALIDCATRIGEGNFWAAAQSVGGVQEIEELRQALHVMAQLLQSERTALQDYLRAVTNTQEEERARLAHELHDETVQTLIALDHKAQQVQRGLDKHPERTREQVAELRKITAQATQEVRRLSYGLRPLGLEEIGLDSALERLAQEGQALYRCQGGLRRLGAERELAFYRIAQESLANVRRHAQAEHVRMILIFGLHTVTLGVGDDGVGFDLPPKLADLTRNGHFGLMGITERAQLIGGRLYCESQPGTGATIIVQAPCEGHGPALDNAVVTEVRTWLAAS